MNAKIPRHWRASDVEETLVIDEKYWEELKDIEPGQRIVVIQNQAAGSFFASILFGAVT
jgi:hypothetical protein